MNYISQWNVFNLCGNDEREAETNAEAEQNRDETQQSRETETRDRAEA